MCTLSASFLEKRFSQSSQPNGLMARWMRWWRFRSWLRLKAWVHSLHLKGRSDCGEGPPAWWTYRWCGWCGDRPVWWWL